jgi:hypothetical protein
LPGRLFRAVGDGESTGRYAASLQHVLQSIPEQAEYWE